MINHIKVECRRAFINKSMCFALIVGCVVAIAQILIDVIPIMQYLDMSVSDCFPLTVFEKCLSLIRGSWFPIYYFTFVPIIAAVPYGTALYSDRKNGYIKNVFTRTDKSNYYIAQYVAAFVSSGTVAVIPQILNVLIISLMLPSIVPYPGIGYVGIDPDNLWCSIYYFNPYVYLIMYWLLDFVFYGLLNTLALSFSWLFKSRFGVIMIPFMALLGLSLIMEFFGKHAWAAESFLRPAQPMIGTSLTEIAVLSATILVLAVFSTIYGIKRKNNCE